ncbi:Flp pilus assembly complex ATPase component TadA, partial [Patescibacteria group bacterium]|nr:Flp pilus assembly complex ATPase component TadA [Patescibacteria group bacterium]
MSQNSPSIEDLMPTSAASTPATNTQVQDSNVQMQKTQKQLQKKIGEVTQGGKEAEAKAMAGALGVEYVELKGFPISPDALTLVPESQAQELQVICFIFTGAEIRLAAIDPTNEKIKDLLHTLTDRHKARGGLYKISEQSFQEAFKLYQNLPKIHKTVKGVQIKQEELEKYQAQMDKLTDIATVLGGASITDVLAIVIAAALKIGSSDIHIEAEEKGIAIRFRVDGILQDAAILDRTQWKKIISRIKLIAGIKLNIDDKPQDG